MNPTSPVLSRCGRAMLRAMHSLFALMLLVTMTAAPVQAQQILRDAESEALLAAMSEPLIRASGLRPEDVHIVMINDRSINAFVAGGQVVYIHSGLIVNADNANQVQGVIAHELGHIAGGHVVRTDGATRSTRIALLSLLLGAIAIAAGAGEAGAGILGAGQQAALGSYLAYSRVQESTADAAGARYLSAAGISGRGSVEFFMKLQNLEMRYNIPQDDDQAYGRTHPLSGDRVQVLRDTYSQDPAWDRPTDPALEAWFQRVRAKLIGFVSEPAQVLNNYPTSDTSAAARYARAYAYHRTSHPDRALNEARALVETDPLNPYYLELEGQILLESGRPADALDALRTAVQQSGGQPLIASLFGHALIATEDPSNYAEAERILRRAVARDNENPFAWYQLGIVYAHNGDEARANLATAERYMLIGQAGQALISAEAAAGALPSNGPDWLRAQDIVLVARARLDEERRRGRQSSNRS